MEKALPPIPAKRYFTIGEVSELCGVKPYVLRYWEQEFTQLKPMKRRGNRRYYQHHEVLLVRRIRDLLYDQGFTISGARNRLTELGHGWHAAAHPPTVRPSCAVCRRTTRRTRRRHCRPRRQRPACRRRTGASSACSKCARNCCRSATCWPPEGPVGGSLYNPRFSRGVAQPGSALAWGARGREFESRRPDQ